MLKYCLEKWNKNKDILEAKLRADTSLFNCDYAYLVKLVVEHVLNNGKDDISWDLEHITEIDNGDYQGTLLFLIPEDSYQPSEYQYLMTYVGYGSCSCCDTLMSIQDDYDEDDKRIKAYMTLCKDILTNIVKPYNGGWREDERFTVVTLEDE